MASQEQIPLRRVIAAAAYGAWMAFLVGVLVTMIGLVMGRMLLTYYPDFVQTVVGVPVASFAALLLRMLGFWKIILGFFGLLGVGLSSWWRAL